MAVTPPEQLLQHMRELVVVVVRLLDHQFRRLQQPGLAALALVLMASLHPSSRPPT